MKSNDESSACSSSSSVVNGTADRSSTFDFAKFKKPPRNITVSANTVHDQKLIKQRRRQQISENEREQQRLDLDIILSGFPVKPVCKTVVQSFLDIHKIPIAKVKTFFQFENKAADQTFHHIVITFADKTSKAQFFAAHSNLQRPIRWNQISGNDGIENNPIIRLNNRFSKFNFGVEKQLRRLKDSGIIAEYKFKNVFYCFKQTPVSEWQDVSIKEDLDHLIDLLKYVKWR
ncbi:hypothetical protein HA402_007742 [Bradysia odoriphaga]|nr:hypothetical protein HA402_007742 [Bradysia odoriphaga]